MYVDVAPRVVSLVITVYRCHRLNILLMPNGESMSSPKFACGKFSNVRTREQGVSAACLLLLHGIRDSLIQVIA